MPSAPNLRAWAASVGVSALVRMPSLRNSSAHSMSWEKSPLSSGCTVGTTPRMISPVLPSSVRVSPVFTTVPRTLSVPALPSMRTSPAPATQGLPMPRATTAAWLVMPPRAVTIPRAASMPRMSSGEVSSRTRITAPLVPPCSSASAAVKTILPVAAPGEAGRPVAITSRAEVGSMVGCRSWSSEAGSTRITASSLLIRPSDARSTATFSAALAVRLPLRVCSM